MFNEIRDSVLNALTGEMRSESSETQVKQFYSKDLLAINLSTSSKGNQPKWFTKDNKLFVKSQFEYRDKLWRDDLVEIIASELAVALSVDKLGVEVVKQNPCKIDDKYGVYSNNFSYENKEEFVPFARLAKSTGLNVIKFQGLDTASRFELVLENLRTESKIDHTNYLVVMALLDCLVGNEDRHLNNFGVLKGEDGNFKLCPLFDFGLGLFEHDPKYERVPLDKCISMMDFQPFSKKVSKVANCLIKNYSKQLNVILPSRIDLSGFNFPSEKAIMYFKYICNKFDIITE